jgi:organic hydroperoxide reductase OsmC/OhrA
MTTMTAPTTVNGINTDALRGAIEAITLDPAKGMTHWEVTSHWRGGTRSDGLVRSYSIGGERVAKDFTIRVDEPLELCGTNKFANPQEHLLAALNACMIVGYAACCALEGIELEELRIETEGDIDLRGFLGISADVKPGYDQLRYTVHIKGSGTPEQFEKIHRTVMGTSPNYFNVTNGIPLKSRLVVG